MKHMLPLVLLALTLSGCTEAHRASLSTYGSSGRVVCYSGGQVIYDDRSEGRVFSTEGGDGYQFKDRATGRFQEVSGDCVVSYEP